MVRRENSRPPQEGGMATISGDPGKSFVVKDSLQSLEKYMH